MEPFVNIVSTAPGLAYVEQNSFYGCMCSGGVRCRHREVAPISIHQAAQDKTCWRETHLLHTVHQDPVNGGL